jgi:predicted  nucleic acid-binding Zn-ribbon protein
LLALLGQRRGAERRNDDMSKALPVVRGTGEEGMSDIVERLRAGASTLAQYHLEEDVLEAADRLAALQQRVEELEEEEKGWQDSWTRLCDEQEARERVLREALEWMDRKGGLGLDVHERIDAALSAHKPVIT